MFLENLESRQLFSISASVDATGALNVVGDAYNNGISVAPSADARSILVQEYTGTTTWYVTRFSFPATSVSSIAVYGMAGADTIQIDSRITLPTGIWGGEGNDWLSGGGGMDGISGENGDDWIEGHGGNDFLYGGAGNDTLNGGAGQDYMNGSVGNDTATYFERTEDLILRPNGRWESGTRSGWVSSENDCINHDIETVIGGSGNDQLFANAVRPGELRGGAGNDTLYGSALNDRLYGETGDDVLHGGLGNDHMVGGFGSDVFYARDGSADVILAGNEDYSGSGWDYDLAQVDAGLDWSMGIHAFLP
jgi:Ca2+-binding RTX toxin-like protein